MYGAYNNNNNNNHGNASWSSPYGGTLGDKKKNDDAGFRSATPDKKGRYSDSVLESLESQNDDQAGEMSKKVKMLKEVSFLLWVHYLENFPLPRGQESDLGGLLETEC